MQLDSHYRVLWLTVLHRAQLEARGKAPDAETPREKQLRADEAQRWLLGQDDDSELPLRDVCKLAGVSFIKFLIVCRREFAG